MAFPHYFGNCQSCGKRMASASRLPVCMACKRRERQPVPRQAHATHIAGYVPPKGSVAFMVLGRVVHPIQGLGI